MFCFIFKPNSWNHELVGPIKNVDADKKVITHYTLHLTTYSDFGNLICYRNQSGDIDYQEKKNNSILQVNNDSV